MPKGRRRDKQIRQNIPNRCFIPACNSRPAFTMQVQEVRTFPETGEIWWGDQLFQPVCPLHVVKEGTTDGRFIILKVQEYDKHILIRPARPGEEKPSDRILRILGLEAK